MLAAEPSSLHALCQAELELSSRGLLRNPKCYSAWHHRLWVLGVDPAPLPDELKLCDKMLQMDARNFHCWNYRRAVAALANTSPQSEFEFTTQKINENFSNYSAWHYRSVLIPRIYTPAWFAHGDQAESGGSDSSEGAIASRRAQYDSLIDSEFNLVKGAFYTEPEDQSAWLYHRWLLGRVVAASTGHKLPVLGVSLGTHLFDEQQPSQPQQHDDATAVAAPAMPAPSAGASLARQLHVFCRELREVQELLTVEEKCKWALLTSAILQAGIFSCLQAQQQQSQSQVEPDPSAAAAVSAAAASAAADATAEPVPSLSELSSGMRDAFERLLLLDPKRRGYYEEVQQRFLQQQQQPDQQ